MRIGVSVYVFSKEITASEVFSEEKNMESLTKTKKELQQPPKYSALFRDQEEFYKFLRTILREQKMARTVIVCDELWLVFFLLVTRCDFSYLAMNCDYIGKRNVRILNIVELYPELVFRYGISWYFLGI